jgi:hypothetical protein
MRVSPKGVPTPLFTVSATASLRWGVGRRTGSTESEIAEARRNACAQREDAVVAEARAHGDRDHTAHAAALLAIATAP